MFTVDRSNQVRRVIAASVTTGSLHVQAFGSERELARLATGWPSARLVLIWNKLPGVTPLRRFSSRKIAVHRIWLQLRNAPPVVGANAPETKTERIIELLLHSKGATLGALMALTGWQSHSVRGFLSAQVSKKRGFRIQSFRRDGQRVYRIRP